MTLRATGLALVLVGGCSGAAAAGDSVLSRLSANASYTIESYAAAFRQSYPHATRKVDDPAVESWNRFTAESRIEFGRDLIFDFKAFAILSTEEDERRGIGSGPGFRGARPRTADLAEGKIRWAGEGFDALAGKMLHSMGVSNLYSPANRFNNVDASHPMRSVEMGVWSTRADIFVGDDTLAAAVIPWQDRTGVPPPRSRWLGSTGSYEFSSLDRSSLGLAENATIETEDGFRGTKVRNYGYLVHYKGSRSGFDFFGVAHQGPSIYPVLRRDARSGSRFVKETPPALTAGGGISATHGAWSYYGEAIAQSTYDGRDQDFLKYVIGISYRETELAETFGLEEIMPILEYAGEGTFGQQDSSRYMSDSRSARPGRDTVLVRLSLRETDKLSYAVGAARNFETRDHYWTAGAEYKISDNLKLRGDVRMFSGSPQTDFGRWARNDHAEIGVVCKF